MQYTKIDTNEINRNIDLRSLAGSYTKLRHHHADEYVGSCPFCGGTKRCGYHQDWFYCRDCRKSGDAIGYMMQIGGLSFVDACKRLAGDMKTMPSLRVEPAPKIERQSPAEWIASAAGVMRKAAGELTYNEPVRSYLEGRKLKPSTWAAFGLGAAVLPLPGTWDNEKREACYPSQPAMALPWINRAGDVVGIRYRFTEKHTYTDRAGNENTDVKLKSRYGSFLNGLFGWQAIECGDKSKTLLIIVEGEINAMSIWQMAQEAGYAIDVLSVGSETQMPKDLGEITSPYARVIMWADRDAVAKRLMGTVNAAYGVCSPNGMDANDLLTGGYLQACIEVWAESAGFALAKTVEPLRDESRLWELWDRLNVYGETLTEDEHAEMVALAARLGKSV